MDVYKIFSVGRLFQQALRRRSLYPFNYENIVRKTHFYRITKIPQNSKPRQSFLCQFILAAVHACAPGNANFLPVSATL
ncbi:hypothetical protein DWZ40_16930 [Clostridium sp. AF32-12BH]|nr:hypothetical protein DWZ40_16930 [Clostridium sp. AF32-12BH]